MSFLVKILFFYIIYRLFKAWFQILIPQQGNMRQGSSSREHQETSSSRTNNIIDAEFRELDD
jgi:hypothetical protein